MPATVKLPTPSRHVTHGQNQGLSTDDAAPPYPDALESAYPGMRERLLDESGDLRHFVNIYLNGEDVRYLDGLNSPVGEKDELSIVPAVAGGQEYQE